MSVGTEHTEPAPAQMSGGEWQFCWAVAVALNLPVVLLFGIGATMKSGLFGMCAGIGAVWLTGAVAVALVPWVRGILVHGSWMFALTQLFPIVQIMAGGTALELCAPGTGPAAGPMSNLTAFLVTVLTAAQLLLVIIVSGLGVRAGKWLIREHLSQDPV